jgi:hypothetical protein
MIQFLAKEFTAVNQPEGLLQFSQNPAIGPYSDIAESSTHLYTLLLQDTVYISPSDLHLGHPLKFST